MNATGHDELAGATWRLFGENWRFDLEKLPIAQPLAHEARGLMPHLKIAQHRLPPKIEVAILETQKLIDFGGLVDREGGGAGGVQDARRSREYLDFSGPQLRVNHSLGPWLDNAFDLEHVLGAHLFGDRHCLRRNRRVEDDLRDAPAVSEVDKDKSTMTASSIDPALQDHRFPGVSGPKLATRRLEHPSLPSV